MRATLPGVGRTLLLSLVLLAFASHANAGELQWSGFALLRGASADDTGPLPHEALSAQLQVGLEWWASPAFGAHVHLLGRSDGDGERAHAGVPEAYLELNLHPRGDRVRVRGGAFFLPTSRENVDALWENPYAISSSALNSWFGEELRPIGVDVSYFHHGGAFAGATVFRGNDTFGALPPARGWTLDDHWTLLGEWVPVDPEYYTSLSYESDGRLSWSARGGWNGEHLLVQLTHLDNRSDGLEHREPLFNWGTRFTIAAAEYTRDDWTFAAEDGWGTTFLVTEEGKFTSRIEAGYALASRRLGHSRMTARFDSFRLGDARTNGLTLAYFWTGIPRVRLGGEVSHVDGANRVLVEARYLFSGR
jgi:hypothetical protein